MKHSSNYSNPRVVLCRAQICTLCSIMLVLSFVLTACTQTTPTPQPAAPTAQPTVATEATKAPEKAASKYKEAPALAELVKAGKLPPVDQRLPENPAVSSAPDIGTYGGFISLGFGNVDQPWNPYIPVDFTSGVWWMSATLFNLKASDPKALTLEPDLAEKYETSADGKTITINLRKGVRWSDGEPFTVDDILFTYNEVIWEDSFTGGQIEVLRSYTTVGGERVRMEKVDDYTFKVILAEPSPGFVRLVFAPMGWDGQFVILPKHEMTKVHPKYNTSATPDDWNSSRLLVNKPAMLSPWIPTSISGDKYILERNPYYWWVDREGNQLPYADQFVSLQVADSATGALALISRDMTVDFFGWWADQVTVLKQSEADRSYKVYVSDAVRPQAALMLNYDTPNESLRGLFRNAEFKDALSMIIDRAQIADKLGVLFVPYKNPLWPATASLIPAGGGAQYDVKEDRQKGLEILDKLGVKDTDGDGWREFPAGTPNAGKPFEFIISAASGETFRVRTAEEVKYQLEGLGIKVVMNVLEGGTFQDNLTTGNYDVKSEGWPESAELQSMDPFLVRAKVPWMILQQTGMKPQYQPVTAETEVLPWQAEWVQVMEDYAAGKIEKEAAFTKVADIVARNYPLIPVAGSHFMNVIPEDVGNNPLDYVPELLKNYWPLPVRDRFELLNYVHFQEWYYKK